MKERVAQPVAPLDKIEDCIYVLRGQKVILDCDLTKLYGVPTKRLNEQVRRNRSKFPEDFLCRLTQEEFEELLRSRPEIVCSSRAGEGMRPQNATSRGHGGRRYLPYAFTEYGALQPANVLNSRRATAMSVYVIRAFVRMRQFFAANQVLEELLAVIEKVLLSHDKALSDIYKKIKRLLLPPKQTHAIGYTMR